MQDIKKVQYELESKFEIYTPAVDAAALKLWEKVPNMPSGF